jgi:fucokinase
LDGTFQQVSEVLRRGEDANIESLYKDFRTPAQFLRLKSTLDQLVLSLPCAIRRARVFKVAADMMADERFAQTQQKEARPAASLTPVDDRAMLRLWGHAYEELAFANVRLAIEASVPTPRQKAARRLLPGISLRVEVPARIDLGGGWSDTPPYSLERGGAVVNFALTLDGQCPVVAWGKTLPQPILRLGSLDLGVTQEITDLEHMGTYDDVEDPLALLKAAAVFEGIVPREAAGPVKAHMQRLGAGVELITECRLPKGSGMGTSSILAAAAVAALTGLRGLRLSVKELFNHVLCVEQMMTTGGGWQDQVGGAVGGIKYVHTTADAPFSPRIEKIKLPAAILQEFNERLVVYYTGHNRLAKNILRQIMGDYLSRRQPVFQTLHEIRATADQVREAFHSRDLNAVGRRMSQSWELNKRLNPTTSNERIDALFAVAAPYIAGGKLAGAGGGGFMALLAKDRASAEHLRKILRGLAMGTEQRLYNAAVDMTGIRVRAE